MKRILYVHQSASLYGSDKTLISLVRGLDKSKYCPIVMLPESGPLEQALRDAKITTFILPLVRAGRLLASIKGIISVFFNIIRSLYTMNRILKNIRIDIVHSNTFSVLSGALWAKLKGIPHVWHVHEIILFPKFAYYLFPWIADIFSNTIVCNSQATLKWLLDAKPSLRGKTTVIWNGLDRIEPVHTESVEALRQKFNLDRQNILVCLVGRINRFKGQGLFIEAANILWERGIRNIHYLIVGSPPPGQEYFKDRLISQISSSPAKDHIMLMDFREDIWTVWDACDIAVVPSTEPEPFGMVALEAMASKKPVIAANNGGLKEIVVHQETGILFESGNALALADSLECLVHDKEKRDRMGNSGFKRLKDTFTLNKYISSFETLFNCLNK